MPAQIQIDREQIADFRRRRRICKLALFGSVLRDDFNSDSDVDVLVKFDPAAKATFFDLFDMERGLSRIMDDRKVGVPALDSVRTLAVRYGRGA